MWDMERNYVIFSSRNGDRANVSQIIQVHDDDYTWVLIIWKVNALFPTDTLIMIIYIELISSQYIR